MECTITFRNLEHTKSLDEKLKLKSMKLEKFLGPGTRIAWTCWIEKNKQVAEASVHHKNQHFIAKAQSSNLYKTMDMVIDKISNQISHRH